MSNREQLLMLCENDGQLLFLETLLENVATNERITRAEAMNIFNKCDDKMRAEITRMRGNGIPVLSDKDAGYFFPTKMQDFNKFSTLYLKAANTRYKNFHKMQEIAFNYFNEQEQI